MEGAKLDMPFGTIPQMIAGKKVIVNHMRVAIHTPNKLLSKRPWMEGRAYHNRVQKKWIRRYGLNVAMSPMIANGEVLYTREAMVMNPATYEQLKEEVQSREGRV